MKMGDKVILHGFIDGYSYETSGQTNYVIALENGERVEVPIECVIEKDQVVKKDEIKLKDIIRRVNRLDENSKTYWLDTILNWFSLDFGLTKYRQGYEQGKLEGEWVGQQLKNADKIRQELNKPVIPQFVADWIEYLKKCSGTLYGNIAPYSYYGRAITDYFEGDVTKVLRWIRNNSEAYARAYLDGYEVEKEKRYLVKVKGMNEECEYLVFGELSNTWKFRGLNEFGELKKYHTRKELEEAGFGWVFDCPGTEVEEVKE